MTRFDVKNRFTGAVQSTAGIECSDDAPLSVKLGLAVKWAIKTDTNLADADLTGAYLAGADLTGAYLAGADLTGAYLARAYLTGANLARADLADAYLTGANLARADLTGANLARANLVDANLADAYLTGVNLAGADLVGANLARAHLARAYLADAHLAGAYLAGANLTGANLARADLIDGGQRSDGYRFVGCVNKAGTLMISAGCRNLTMTQARQHWRTTRGGTALGAETFAILDHIEAVARIRSLIPEEQNSVRETPK